MSESLGQSIEEKIKPIEQSIGVLESSDIHKSLIPQEIQDKIEKTTWNEAKGNQGEEYKKFGDYISSLPEGEREGLFQFILGINGMKLKKYIQDNGYIINLETAQSFKVKFGKKTQEQDKEENKVIIEKDNVTTEKKEEGLKKIKGFTDIFASRNDAFANIPEFQKLIERAKKLNPESNTDEIGTLNTDIVRFLSDSKSGNLEKIATSLKSSGDEAGYQEFKTYANSLSPELSSRFAAFETAPQHISDIPSDLHQAQIVGGLGTEDFKKYGNIVEATQDGQTTRMDIGEIPPRRFVALQDTNYSLETDVPVGDFYKAVSKQGLDYEKTAQTNGSKIEYLSRLENPEVKEFLSGVEFQKESLANCIRIISGMIGLPIGQKLEDICGRSFANKDDLKTGLSSSGLIAQTETLKKEINDKKQAYQKALASEMQQYKKTLEKKDTKTKEVLTFLQSIGFTDIPQSITDQIISMINRNPQAYGFDEAINLAEGKLGMDKVVGESTTLDMQDKVAFVKIINKMLGFPQSDANAPIIIANLTAGHTAVGSNFKGLIANSGILDVGGVQIALSRIEESQG